MYQNAYFCSVASSSKGNAHVLRAGNRTVLIDCGISVRRLVDGLNKCGVALEDIDYVFISHTHTDHVVGLYGLLRKCSPKVFGPPPLRFELGAYNTEFVPLKKGITSLNGLSVKVVELSHDSSPTFGFRFESDGVSVGVATDLGVWNSEILETMSGVDLLLWESNHDEGLLECGRYPLKLKHRISGPRGHLSNIDSLNGVLNMDRLPATLLLGHLSRENNRCDLVRDTYESAHLEKHLQLRVIDPGCSSDVVDLSK